MLVVRFINLGRAKANFERVIQELEEGAMLNAIRTAPAGQGIMSRDVSFTTCEGKKCPHVFDERPDHHGEVWVGGFRKVGDWIAHDMGRESRRRQ